MLGPPQSPPCILEGHNQSKTKKLDGIPAERRLSSERNNGGKNGGEERKRKTKAKTIGLDNVGGIR